MSTPREQYTKALRNIEAEKELKLNILAELTNTYWINKSEIDTAIKDIERATQIIQIFQNEIKKIDNTAEEMMYVKFCKILQNKE